MRSNILTLAIFFLFCLVLLTCKKETTSQDISESAFHYNLDFDPVKQITLPDFLDSIRMTKVILEEPILLKWFAGHILKASKDYFFLKTGYRKYYLWDRQIKLPGSMED